MLPAVRMEMDNMRRRSWSLAFLLLAGLVTSCGGTDETGAVGCVVSTAHGFIAVPPDAPFTVRYKAVRDDVRAINEPTLLLAAMCAEKATPSACKPASPELQAQCVQSTADDATCAWVEWPLSRDPLYQAGLEDTCRCLQLDAEWCHTAAHDGEERAALSILRRRDRLGYMSTCSLFRNIRPCWWLLRELVGYPVDGPAVTAWNSSVLARRIAAGTPRLNRSGQ